MGGTGSTCPPPQIFQSPRSALFCDEKCPFCTSYFGQKRAISVWYAVNIFGGKFFTCPFQYPKVPLENDALPPPPIVWCFLRPCCLERTRRCMLHACASIIYVVTKRYRILMIFCLTCSLAFADRQLYVLCCMWQHMWGVLGRNDGRRKTNEDHFCRNVYRIPNVEVR